MMISCRCYIRLNHLNTVRCLYDAAICLQIPHNRHSTGEIWCCGSNVCLIHFFATVIRVSYVISLYHTRTIFIFMCVNPWRPGDAYMRQWTELSLIHVMGRELQNLNKIQTIVAENAFENTVATCYAFLFITWSNETYGIREVSKPYDYGYDYG